MYYKITVPPTMEMGSYFATVSDWYTSKSVAALSSYNSARAHDGLKPVKRMPNGTQYNPLYVYEIQQYTGGEYGWECVNQEATRAEAFRSVKEYGENQPEYPVRIRRRCRAKITGGLEETKYNLSVLINMQKGENKMFDKKYQFTSDELTRLLHDTMGLVYEYNHVHGWDMHVARDRTILEVFEGLEYSENEIATQPAKLECDCLPPLVEQEGNGSICEIAHVYSLKEAEANARLIAAAPLLLFALQDALKALDFAAMRDPEQAGLYYCPLARKAIAKAQG